MAIQYYDVIIERIKEDTDFQTLTEQLAKLYKKDTGQIKYLLNGPDRKLHKRIDYQAATKTKAVLERLGVKCTIEASWQLVEKEPEIQMYTCPACGHTQEPSKDGTDTCIQCGVVGNKYEKVKKRTTLVESEQRRYELQKQLREKLRTEQEEKQAEEQERNRIRKQFGWERARKANPLLISSFIGLPLISVTALALVLQGKDANDTISSPKQASNAAVAVSNNVPADPSSNVSATKRATTTASSQDEFAAQHALQLAEKGQSEATAGNTGSAQQAFENALEAAKEIEKPHLRSETVATIAQNQASTGQVSHALHAAEQIPDTKIRASTLTNIAAARSHAKDKPGARKALAAFMDTASATNNDEPGRPTKVYAFLVDYCIKTHDFSQALELSSQIEDAQRRTEALSSVAEAQIAVNKHDAARETLLAIANSVGKISSTEHKTELLATTGRLYAQIGDHKNAKKYLDMASNTADNIEPLSDRVTVLSRIAKQQFLSGYVELSSQTFSRAKELGTLVVVHPDSPPPLHRIAIDQASINEFAAALKTIEQIESAYWRAITLTDVGKVQIGAGEKRKANKTFARALEESSQITSVEKRAKLLTEITQAQLATTKTPSAATQFDDG